MWIHILNDFATHCFRNIHTYVVFVERESILGSHENLDKIKYVIALQIKYYIYSMRWVDIQVCICITHITQKDILLVKKIIDKY